MKIHNDEFHETLKTEDELRSYIKEVLADWKEYREEVMNKLEETSDLKEDLRDLESELKESHTKIQHLDQTVKKKEFELYRAKAKLYDLMCNENTR